MQAVNRGFYGALIALVSVLSVGLIYLFTQPLTAAHLEIVAAGKTYLIIAAAPLLAVALAGRR